MQLSADIFSQYAEWAFSSWFSPHECGDVVALDGRDFAIMGLGLCGETVEVLCALDGAQDAPGPTPDLLKELGDVVFYAAVLAVARGIQLALPLHPTRAPTWSISDSAARLEQAYALVRPAGQLAELLKKYIRDGASPDEAALDRKLGAQLQGVLTAWLSLCYLCGATPEEVLLLNQAKVNSRRDRGVMRGSGDNR